MLIVPLAGDKIKIANNDSTLKVIEYTRFKSAGPAVYCQVPDSKTLILVYFFDIEEINGVDVEYKKSSHLFKALGKVKRKYNIPQKGDVILITRKGSSTEEDDDALEKKKVKVDKVEIKLGKSNLVHGLFVTDEDKNLINCKRILDVESEIGTQAFDRSGFIKYYKEYFGE